MDGGQSPAQVDIAYTSTALESPILWSIVDSWLLYFYLPPTGKAVVLVPAARFDMAVFATRALNAVAAPPIGYLFDYTRSRWGRRRPFMVVSALSLSIFLGLLWTPPVPGQSIWNLAYLVVILALYNATYGLVLTP